MGTPTNPLEPSAAELAAVRGGLDERDLSSADLNAYVVGAAGEALRLAAEARTPAGRDRWIRNARAWIAVADQVWAEWKAEFDA